MAQMEQINPLKNQNQNLSQENQLQKKKKRPSQTISLQNKIKELSKQISSMKEYISVLEKKSKLNHNINNDVQNSNESIIKLKQEKEEILSQLKQEIILNDEQRNYIEILKQALESNIAKHGLTEQINFLKKKYYSGEGGMAQVILDLSKLKENNDSLKKEKEKNSKKINELNIQKEQFNIV